MKAIKNLVFATDFSKTSAAAKDMVVELKQKLGCRVDVVHVYDASALAMPAPYANMTGVEQWLDEHFAGIEEHGRDALAELCPSLGEDCTGHFIEGRPGPAIVKFCEQHDCDLLIMGTHGHNWLNRVMLGSCADYVLRHAPCPVMTIKNPEH
jgi:nucleotide-binding universal stress UspA family protein